MNNRKEQIRLEIKQQERINMHPSRKEGTNMLFIGSGAADSKCLLIGVGLPSRLS
jgi:hypothetical protein